MAETYSISRPLTGHQDAVNGVAFSPDGRLLATASLDTTARLWQVGSGELAAGPLTGHEAGHNGDNYGCYFDFAISSGSIDRVAELAAGGGQV